MEGKLVIVSAPSGSGKTTIIRHLMAQNFNLYFSVSATNRAPREHETNGKDYLFLSTDAFQEKIKNNDFLEWEEVYKDRFYGSLKSHVNQMLSEGKNVIFDVDVVGGLNIKSYYQEKALSMFIKLPSLETLEMRLRQRGTDDETDIMNRLEKAAWEMNFAEEFDTILINDNLPKCLKDAENLVSEFLEKA
ncbi:MAG: guanylate kinase [Bacteroidota bacterium]|nr:guanylate kinase [Bacteroidota bacterium]